MSESILSIRGLHKTFAGGHEGVRGLSLEVARGEYVALLGESGSGKTTVLRTINRLVERSAGSIELNGQDVATLDPVELRRSIGYVFQQIGLFPHLTVAANVGLVPSLLGWEKVSIRRRAEELLELVKLPPARYASRYPAELSGGQQQRVGVARALAARPNLVLMDEPFGALDPLTRASLQDEYMEIHRELGLTTIMVTHDVAEALLMADRVGLLRSGRLVAVGSPADLLRQERDGYVGEILGSPVRQWERLAHLLPSERES